jgi:S-adenosylmethionine:tRNA ribosyltransferase-isomerase
MRLDEFDYHLPAAQIAQRPLDRRDASRLLRLDRELGTYEDGFFADLPALLRGDELLVLNNARVIPARLFGRRIAVGASRSPSAKSMGSETSGGRVEVFLCRQREADVWEAMVQPGKKMRVGQKVEFGEGELSGEVCSYEERGVRTLRFVSNDTQTVAQHLERLGHVPLPPYIERADEDSDRERYQTVFASRPGAIAAPTAGLHFTPEMLEKLKKCGAEICEITLDVGLGTFQPIHGDTLEGHKMHVESYEISPQSAQQIQQATATGRTILAIGTTSVRALEDSALRAVNSGSGGLLLPGRAEASLFITPGFSFRVVKALLTNFHLPRSTLLALVSAFAGREKVLTAYKHAVEAGYRFYSYGDCMLIR